MTLIHQVDETAGRGDDDLGAGAQRLDLRPFADATIHSGDAQMEMARVLAHVLFDLHDQLAGWSDDQGAHDPAVRRRAAGGEALQNRKHERGGLAGAGLGDSDDVVAAQHERDCFGLDGGRFCVAGFAHGFGDFRVEPE